MFTYLNILTYLFFKLKFKFNYILKMNLPIQYYYSPFICKNIVYSTACSKIQNFVFTMLNAGETQPFLPSTKQVSLLESHLSSSLAPYFPHLSW